MTPFQSVFWVKTCLIKTILRCYPVYIYICIYKSSISLHREFCNMTLRLRTDWKLLQRTACLTKCQTMATNAEREDEKDKNTCLMSKPFGTDFVLYLYNPSASVTWLVTGFHQYYCNKWVCHIREIVSEEQAREKVKMWRGSFLILPKRVKLYNSVNIFDTWPQCPHRICFWENTFLSIVTHIVKRPLPSSPVYWSLLQTSLPL